MNNTGPSTAGRGGLWKRVFAWATARGGDMVDGDGAARKRVLLGGLHGAVLEIGPGAGPNLAYYPADVRWLGVEPNPYMHPYLLRAAQAAGIPAERFRIDPGDPRGVRLPAPDESMDAVVSTLVLCSVPHQEGSLQEILRVLRPGGQFVFIEHVAAPRGTFLRALQDGIQPLWSLVGEGCHPNRETWAAISSAGFERVEIEHYRFPEFGPAGPHIAGRAVKRGAGMLQ